MYMCYIKVPAGTIVDLAATKSLPKNKVVIVSTGSQGENMSALYRMAFSMHKQVDIVAGDRIIISASAIPGNEVTVSRVINELFRKGVKVVYDRADMLHVSGHACQGELRLIHALVRPRYFIPVHGEQKHLRYHAKLAESIGIPHNNIIIGDNGYEISVSDSNIAVSGTVTHGKVYVDGYGVGDVGTRVMRERQHLGTDGIIIIAATIDAASGELVTGPDIVSKGFVYVKEAELLMNEAVKVSMRVIDSFPPYSFDINAMNTKLRDEISRLMYERTKRNPMILPILLEV